MDIKTEQDKRMGLGSELADIAIRQRAIVQWNDQLSRLIPENEQKTWQALLDEDHKNLRMLESVMASFGVRIDPKPFAEILIEIVSQRINDEHTPLMEKLGAYALVKQAQLMCGHLVHKSVQIALPDIKEALAPLKAVQADFERHRLQISGLVERIGVEAIMGAEPVTGVAGRLRDALATVGGAVLSKTGKPADEMSVLNVLRMDHAKTKTLFLEIEQTQNAQNRNDLFIQLRNDLLAHAEAEEHTVYSYFQRYDELQEFFDASRVEHEQMRAALDRANSFNPSSEEFSRELKSLKDITLHHVEEEENEVFAFMTSKSNSEELRQLAAAFIQTKVRIQEELSPYLIDGFPTPGLDSDPMTSGAH